MVTCGGDECLVPYTSGNGASGHLNVCSTPSNLQSCGVTDRCSCNLGDPSSCPNGATAVCRASLVGSPSCVGCGDNNTDGLPCKGGGTCAQASKHCN